MLVQPAVSLCLSQYTLMCLIFDNSCEKLNNLVYFINVFHLTATNII